MGFNYLFEDLEKDKKQKNISRLDFNFNNLDEDGFCEFFSFILKSLDNYKVDNISFSFSCDYWESDLLDEEDI